MLPAKVNVGQPVQLIMLASVSYDAAASTCKTILSAPLFLLSGFLSHVFHNEKMIENFAAYNKRRRDINRQTLCDAVRHALRGCDVIPAQDVSSAKEAFRKMFEMNDFSALIGELEKDALTNPGVAAKRREQILGLELLAQQPLAVRQALYENFDNWYNLGLKVASSMIVDSDPLSNTINHILHTQHGVKPEKIVKGLLLQLLDVKKPDHNMFRTSDELTKWLFEYGTKISEFVGCRSKSDCGGEPGRVVVYVELTFLLSLYLALYPLKLIKHILVQPADIFKHMLAGFLHGLHGHNLSGQPAKELQKMLVGSNFWAELHAVYSAAYEGYSKKHAEAQEQDLQYSLEVLIAQRTHYLRKKELDAVIPAIDDEDADLNNYIKRDNTFVQVFAILNTVPVFSQKLLFTISSKLGQSCESFASYVASKHNSSQQINV